jgi:hypothetical protein
VYINVIDIKKGSIVAKINPFCLDTIQGEIALKNSGRVDSVRSQI